MLTTQDEREKTKIWKHITRITSVLIILIAIFFLVKLFTANPLEGKWEQKDNGMKLNFKSNGVAVAQWPNEAGDAYYAVSMQYSVVKDSKMVIITIDEAALQKAVEKADEQTAKSLTAAISDFAGTYDYNIEKRQLTLSEWEGGKSRTFIRH